MIRVPASAAVVVLALAASSAEAAADDVRRYAVIVAHDEHLEGKVPDLEYADDDAARYFEFYEHIADEVLLYSVLDRDTQRIHKQAASAARTPARQEVFAGIEDVFEQAERDKAEGYEVEFTFILAGHGDIGPGGEGYISLLDAPFTRSDLYQRVLAESPATTNHVVIDACNAFFLVHRRGGEDEGPGRGDVVDAFLEREELAQYPNTGVLLSTSSEAETHEWSAYRAGVFSHMVRSALSGAADVNGDGRIEYSEVEAFVAAANARIDDPRARVDIFARPPSLDESRPIVDLGAADFEHWLEIPGGAPLRLYLEDSRGVRYMDTHSSGERDTLVGLPRAPHYFVRTTDDRRKARVELEGTGRLTFDRDRLSPAEIAARSAVADAFRVSLFSEPFGPSFYHGYISGRDRRPIRSGVEAFRPDPAPRPACARQAAQVARSRGLVPGDRPELDAAIRALGGGVPEGERAALCQRAQRAAESTPIDADIVRARIADLNERSARDPALAARLTESLGDVARLLDGGRYDEAAALLSETARGPE